MKLLSAISVMSEIFFALTVIQDYSLLCLKQRESERQMVDGGSAK